MNINILGRLVRERGLIIQMERTESRSVIKCITKGVAIAFIFTVIALTVFSLLLVNTDMSENLTQPVVIGVTCISILFGSFIGNRKNTKNGIFNGAIVGLVYIAIIYIISSIINGMNFSMNLGSIIMMALGIIGGAVGGIIGVNIG